MFRAHVPARVKRAGLCRLLLLAFAALAANTASIAREAEAPLQFRISEGRTLNAFHQQGPVAAHLLLSSGTEPRILVAFPAGNSGVGLWFEHTASPVRWTLDDVRSLSRTDDRGRTLHGIVADVAIDAPLVVRDAVLSSVRVLRDYQLLETYPAEIKSEPTISGDKLEWARPRLDGAAGYVLSIAVDDGQISGGRGSPLKLAPARADAPMRLSITALTGEPPLTPFDGGRLLNADAIDDERSEQVLRFLSYEEKFLAGSWRFNTYFGRDTLMSVRLLMPALQPDAIERALMSVLQRLAPNGEVAHEEDIGEFAVLRHRKEDHSTSDAPIYDYKMIDDDFMLAPIAAAYAIDHPLGRKRAKEFLAASLPNGERVGAALARNFAWVARSARAFADNPKAANLISLKPGINVGQWRDSEDGLAGGRYPYDVNAVLVPAAMDAIAKFSSSGLLAPYLSPEQQKALTSARTIADVWSREAPAMFRVRLSAAEAREHVRAYAAELGVDPARAIESLPKGDLQFDAIALDARHAPIPIVHSDGGFALLLQDAPATVVADLAENMLRPFPAGLLTDAGLLVANPAFADAEQRKRFGRNAYHGTVVWSWQQALLAAGLDRQIARTDLPKDTIERLRDARQRLSSVIAKTRDMRASELWSWRYANGRYETAPFGQNTSDADESNAAQLWSTVYLAVGM